jgi:hypothetical protein
VALWTKSFDRGPEWIERAVDLFQAPPGGTAVDAARVVAVLPGTDQREREASIARAPKAKGGWILAQMKIDQSWEPRIVRLRQ